MSEDCRLSKRDVRGLLHEYRCSGPELTVAHRLEDPSDGWLTLSINRSMQGFLVASEGTNVVVVASTSCEAPPFFCAHAAKSLSAHMSFN